MTERVVVLGGTGFVGSATVLALRDRGAEVCVVPAPRLPPTRVEDVDRVVREAEPGPEFVESLKWARVVVNAAGVADATQADDERLIAANAALPLLVARATRERDVARFVHVSSASVQGAKRTLDASTQYFPFSPYSSSKMLGELGLLELVDDRIVIYRPQGVHGADRQVTRTLIRFSRSPLASVAGDGKGPAPHALIENVADAIALVALTEQRLPPIVTHPWEGLTTSVLQELLGSKPPRRLPARLARGTVASSAFVGRQSPRAAAYARRLEVLWFGQAIAPSWLDSHGWRPPAGEQTWRDLAASIASR